MPKRVKLRVKLFSHVYLGFARGKRDATIFKIVKIIECYVSININVQIYRLLYRVINIKARKRTLPKILL